MKGIEAIKGFKQKQGPPSKELLERVKTDNKSLSAIKKAMAAGKKNVPDIASETGLKTADVFWYLNALKKYGEAEPAGEIEGELCPKI